MTKKSRWATVFIAIVVCVSTTLFGCQTVPDIQEFSFVTISDVHVPSYAFPIGMSLDETSLMQMHNQKRLQEFVAEFPSLSPRPSFIMNLGDTGDAGWTPLLKLYQKLMQPLVSAGTPIYTVVGNHDHDYAGIGRQDLAEMFDPLGPEMIGCHGSRYSFDYGGCHFIVMNNRPVSGLIRFNPKDIEWLKTDLETIKQDTRVLLFLHANMHAEDTHHVVELLQNFTYPVIFQGHRHRAGIDSWGNIPVVLTGSLYSGDPEAGSYQVVTVSPEGIFIRTRDFAKSVGEFEPDETITFRQPGPQVHVIEPDNEALVSGEIILSVETKPLSQGTLEYSIPGITDWTQVPGENGTWEASVKTPSAPGRYLMTLRFTGDDSSVVLAHRDIKAPGNKVHEVWLKDLGSGMQGAPVIHDDIFIVPTIEGGVYALRMDDGAEVWHQPVTDGQIIGRMAVFGSTVFYGAGRTVQACDAQSGEHLWQTLLDRTVIAGVTAGNGKLYVPAGDDKLYCLDTVNGKVLWSYRVTRPIIMEAATDSGRVFFGAMDGYIRSLDGTTGNELWSNQWSSMDDKYTTAPFWPPVATGNLVISCKNPVDGDEKNLVAFDASNGKVVWSRRVNSGTMRTTLSPEKDLVYTSSRENRRSGLQCLSVADGSPVWSSATGIDMNSGIATRKMVIQRNAYNLCCVDATDGSVQWTYRTNTGPQGSYYGPGAFAVKGNMVVVGTMGGKVMGLQW
ncbi:PQQ-binding-like beta-propeller repeat protein [Candidatus Latescibacterota bacterium]